MTLAPTLSPSLLELRYRGRGGHIESWILKLTEPGGQRALYVKISVLASSSSGVPPLAEAWAIAFDRERGAVATKTAVPLDEARFAKGTLDAEVDGCTLSLRRSHGAIATGERKVSWELAIGAGRDPFMPLPLARLYEAPFPSSKAVSPFADARVSGEVKVDRGDGAPETWDVASWPAMLGHEWGTAHPRVYAWAHCNEWDAQGGGGEKRETTDLVFVAMSSRVRMGPVLSPLLTAVLVRWRGRRWALNARELFGKNRASVSMRRYEVSAKGEGLTVRAEMAAETDDFVGLHAPNPSGVMTYGLSAMLARARLELTLEGRDPTVVTSRAAALELGTRDREHGVRMVL